MWWERTSVEWAGSTGAVVAYWRSHRRALQTVIDGLSEAAVGCSLGNYDLHSICVGTSELSVESAGMCVGRARGKNADSTSHCSKASRVGCGCRRDDNACQGRIVRIEGSWSGRASRLEWTQNFGEVLEGNSTGTKQGWLWAAEVDDGALDPDA